MSGSAGRPAAHDKDMVVVNQPSSLAHTAPRKLYRKFPHGCCQRAIFLRASSDPDLSRGDQSGSGLISAPLFYFQLL
jgi:hypothetical protein